MFLKLFLKGFLIFFISFANSIFVFGQDKLFEKINSIKNNDNYLWGEGQGIIYQSAKNNALSNLSSKISVQIESDFKHVIHQTSGKKVDFIEVTSATVKSFSGSALYNVEEITLPQTDNESDFNIFVYIKKSEIRAIYEQRMQKIYSYINLALENEEKLQIGDAIRYLYWSQQLIKSMPQPNTITFKPKNKTDSLVASTFIENKLNDIFSNIKVQISKKV